MDPLSRLDAILSDFRPLFKHNNFNHMVEGFICDTNFVPSAMLKSLLPATTVYAKRFPTGTLNVPTIDPMGWFSSMLLFERSIVSTSTFGSISGAVTGSLMVLSSGSEVVGFCGFSTTSSTMGLTMGCISLQPVRVITAIAVNNNVSVYPIVCFKFYFRIKKLIFMQPNWP